MDRETQPGGIRHTPFRGILRFVALSLLLHVPFTPLAGLLGLFTLLSSLEEVPDRGEIRGIPVELLVDDPGAHGAPPPPAEEPPSGAEANPASPEVQARDAGAPQAKDAGIEDAGLDAGPEDAGLDAGPEDAGADAAAPSDAALNDAGAQDAAVDDASAQDAGDAGNEAVADAADAGAPAETDAGDAGADPVALSGSAGKVVDSNANVRAIIYTEGIRNHALGARLGRVLRSLYQWRDFFGPTGLDPIRDVDRILIAGPQFRDSSQIVVVLQHHIPPKQLKLAIDGLVKRDPGGAWLPTQPPTARATADRAERYFVMVNDRLVIVAPKSAAEDAMTKRGNLSLPPAKGREVMVAYLVTPWSAFVGMPLPIPKSIKWARAVVELDPGGKVVLNLESEDESEASAVQTARDLERAVGSIASLNLGVLGAFLGQRQHRFLESFQFQARGTKVVGSIVATDAQVGAILDLLEAALAPRPPRPRPATAP